MIGLVDYGAGNLCSVRTALERIGQKVKTVKNLLDLAGVDRLILPGVGHFGSAAVRLKESGLFEALKTWAESGRPLLGICLGLQLLFEESEEDGGKNPGLGTFRGRIVRLRGPRLLHVGWNTIIPRKPEGSFGPGVFYFVHEFAPQADHLPDVLAESRFGDAAFPAVVGRKQILGVQFHPEKSGTAGLAFLERWAGGGGRRENTAETTLGGPGLSPPAPAVRIIPCLDMDDGRVVKGIRFADLRDAGDPVERARFYDRQGADEICFLDIGATWKSRRTLLEIVRRVSREIFVPLTVGGGLRSREDIREALDAGADKISLGTAAVDRPDLLREAAESFGRQCVVVSIDAKSHNGDWEVTTHGGRCRRKLAAADWARQAEAAGAGEILLNSVDRDGTASGFDLGLLRRIRDTVRIPVIASGGGDTPSHAWTAVSRGRADAVLLASVLHDGRRTIEEFKAHLRKKGAFVR